MGNFSPIQHPVYKLHNAVALTAAGGATESATSVWIDVGGWSDKCITVEQDNAGTPDLDVILHMSEQDAYTLNNKTCTTEDYEAVTIVGALAGTTLTYYDSQDVDELQRTFRSARVYIENDSATAITAVTVTMGGST